MNRDRNWTVLFIGGASGMGKSSVAYELARFYNVNVMEVDDVYAAVKAMTTRESHPAVHYWSSGINWMEIGVRDNVKWLIDVSKEMVPGLGAIVENHLEADIPVIIEGDFLDPAFTASFQNPKVKSIFVYEPDTKQVVQNYFAREGGELQYFRADISIAYGDWLMDACRNSGIKVIEPRPWDTAAERIVESML